MGFNICRGSRRGSFPSLSLSCATENKHSNTTIITAHVRWDAIQLCQRLRIDLVGILRGETMATDVSSPTWGSAAPWSKWCLLRSPSLLATIQMWWQRRFRFIAEATRDKLFQVSLLKNTQRPPGCRRPVATSPLRPLTLPETPFPLVFTNAASASLFQDQ